MKPKIPQSIVAVQIPRDVAEKLRAEARRHDRSTSGQLRRLIRDWAANWQDDEVERPS